MRSLLACTCLTSVAFALGTSPARAERVINDDLTSPVATSTANNGTADDIEIGAEGSVIVSSGTAVTIDSNHKVENKGTVQISDANNATGIFANPGLSSGIANSGKIIIDEDYTAEDGDDDGDIDGPFAEGSGRHGIRVGPGGTFTGNVSNSGEISIEGNDSAGVALDSRLQGSLTNSGKVAVVGDRSVGIRAGDVSGNVRLTGDITAQGEGAVGVALDGDIGGALSIQGSIASTGYRSTSAPSDTSKLDDDDLLQGGPAVRIAGDVAGGVIFDAPPPDLDKEEDDEDDDGIKDAQEGIARVTSYGEAPAVQIGAADRDVTIGAVAGHDDGHGLVINGVIAAAGVYEGVNGTGLLIGGLGGDVTIAGGMTVAGAVTATSRDATATAIHIGDGASVDEIRITGEIEAASGGEEDSVSRGILIDEGATVTSIHNSGDISATASAKGAAGAIVDRSGSVSLVENTGSISAGGSAATGGLVAIDLSENDSGAVVRQNSVEQGVASPTIAGDILFGAGDDLLVVADGSVTGATRFGAGTNSFAMSGDAAYTGDVTFGAGDDRMTMAGTTVFSGSADFGGGTDLLRISDSAVFSGNLVGGSGLAVRIDGGTLDAANLGTVSLSSLTVGGEGVLGVRIDAAEGTNTLYDVAGAAAFEEGTGVRIQLAGIGDSDGRYVFLRAGQLTGTGGIELTDESLPFLFKGTLDADEATGELAIDVERKKASELGLNGSETRAYEAVMDALDNDADVADVFLSVADGDTFRSTFRQMLPDHAGGAFDTVTQGSRATARYLMDPDAPFADRGGWGFWLQQVAWGSSKDLGDTAAYDVSGWGATGGAEMLTDGAGNFGLSLAYLTGKDEDGETNNRVRSEQFELAAYWRGQWGGLRAHARASAAMVGFDGTRVFSGSVAGDAVDRRATGSWDGQLYSVAAGASYEMNFGRFSLRPIAAIDYYRLQEDGYTESGGGDAFNLTVEDRTSDELAATASLAAGLNFGSTAPGERWLRTELEGGRRTIVGGSLGETIARIGDGEAFTLLPEERTNGWIGRFRVMGGVDGFTLGGEFSAEEQHEEAAIAFRVSLQLGF